MLCLTPRPALAQSGGYSVSGTVALEQCAASVAPTQSITFTFVSVNHSNVITLTPTLGSGGSFTIPNIPADNYTLSVKGSKWLRANKPVDTTGGDVTGVSVLLRGGDCNNDNFCDPTDFNIFVSAYNSDINIPGSGYDDRADFNCDGLVDPTDFGIFVGNYSGNGDDYVGLLTSTVTSAGIVLTWQGSSVASGVSGYHLYRSTQSGNYAIPGPGVLIYTGTGTTATDLFTNTDPTTKLPKAATYYIVKAYSPIGESAASNEVVAAGRGLYRIDCGGPAFSPFVADAYYTGGSGVSTTLTPNTTTVSNPAPAGVYQTARAGTPTTGFTYTFPGLTPGAFYTVNLDFADFGSTASGQRQFNVAVNSASIEQNLDIYAIVGTGAALQRQYTVLANSGGNIIVAFSPGASGSPICNGIEILTAPPAAPTNLQALCTGNSKITLYWDDMPGATGYNVYRGVAEDGENYLAPINGTTPITLAVYASYMGSSTLMYSDSGLANGTTYSYTVRAIYPTGISPMSVGDSEIPDSDGIPWDTRAPGSIISAVTNAFSNDQPDLNNFHVVGPDGTIYDSGFADPQQPDGQLIAGANSFQLASGEMTILPATGIALAPVANAPAGNWPATHGPNRRVVSTPDGYRGVGGDMLLTQPNVVPNTGDTPEVHLGSHLKYPAGSNKANDEVDAGVTYGPRGWGVFLNSNGNYASSHGGKGGDPNFPIKATFAVKDDDRFAPGTLVNMAFYAYSLFSNNGVANPKRICLIAVSDPLVYKAIGIAAPTRLTRNKSELKYLVMKRVHAIAQTFPKGSIFKSNLKNTGSSWTGVMWGETDNSVTGDAGPGKLLDNNGNWLLWTQNRTYRPGFPSQNYEPYLAQSIYIGGFNGVPILGSINVNTQVPYSNEFVDIFCHP